MLEETPRGHSAIPSLCCDSVFVRVSQTSLALQDFLVDLLLGLLEIVR